MVSLKKSNNRLVICKVNPNVYFCPICHHGEQAHRHISSEYLSCDGPIKYMQDGIIRHNKCKCRLTFDEVRDNHKHQMLLAAEEIRLGRTLQEVATWWENFNIFPMPPLAKVYNTTNKTKENEQTEKSNLPAVINNFDIRERSNFWGKIKSWLVPIDKS